MSESREVINLPEYAVTTNQIYEAHEIYRASGYANKIHAFYCSLPRLTRCRDCKHWKEGMKGIMFCEAVHLVRSADDYCSKAEPKLQ